MSERGNNIKQKIRQNQCQFTSHALNRMNQRKIWKNDVFNAILFGVEVEIQEDGNYPDTHILFQEHSPNPEFCIVVADSEPDPFVITVFYFYENIWEYRGNVYQRRKRK
jgi:hypothetical protein